MHSKINIHNFWRSHTFIILMFAIMSVMSSVIMWHYKYIGIGVDGFFHAQRIYDLRMSWNHGILVPLVSLNGYNQTGQASMTMYPQMILYPMILLSYFIKSVVPLVYFAFTLRNLFAFIVSYYSCYRFNRSKKISFIFAIVYTLSSIVLCYVIIGFDVGRSASLIFLPLVLFGFYELLNNNKWLELSIGMTMIVFSHVINTIIAIIFVWVLLIFNMDKINVKKIIGPFIKAIAVCVLMTSIFWIPFFQIYATNKISVTAYLPNLVGVDLIHSLFYTFHNAINPTAISIFALIGLIFSCIYYKKLSDTSKQMLWISIIFLLFMSNLFPWYILNGTIIKNVLQFPWRFMIIPQLLLSYLFAETFVKFFFHNNRNISILIPICIVVVVSLQLCAQKETIDVTMINPELSKPFSGNTNFKLYTNSDLNNLIHNDLVINDYYPANAVSSGNLINEKKATYDGRYLYVSLHGNGKSSFDAPEKINSLTLPFLYYNGVNYQVKLDGKTVKAYPNKHALMTINNVSKGNHHVQILVHRSMLEIISYVLSLSGLIILLRRFLKDRKKSNNKKY